MFIQTNKCRQNFDWRCLKSWKQSAKNTFWCLLGCSIGDYGTLLLFQFFAPGVHTWIVMLIAPVMGLFTSISTETLILLKQMRFKAAVKTAFGMSILSMLLMELSANTMAFLLTGGARLSLIAIVPSIVTGFLAAWIYNYYKLKKHGKACH